MRATIIYQTPSFTVTSYGNGLSYDFRNTAAGRSVCFQGDDARMFRDEIDAREEYNPEQSSEHMLSAIWSDYSEVSRED